MISLTLALLIAAALLSGVLGGRFAVTEVVVDGATLTPPETIAGGAGVLGMNVFTVNAREVASRLALQPTIRRVAVWTELPGRVRVTVWERQVAVLWKVGDTQSLVDPDGRVLVLNPPASQTAGVVPVSAPGQPVPAPGQSVDGRVVRTVLAVGQEIRDVPVAAGSSIEYVPADGVVLALQGGQRVIIGDGTRIAEKLAVLGALREAPKTWTLLDLRDPDRPYYR